MNICIHEQQNTWTGEVCMTPKPAHKLTVTDATAKARTQADSHWCDSQSSHTGWQSLIAVRGRLQLHAALDSSVHSLWTVGTEGVTPPLSAGQLGLFLSSSITEFDPLVDAIFIQILNTCEKDGHRAWHRSMQIEKTDIAKYRLSNE